MDLAPGRGFVAAEDAGTAPQSRKDLPPEIMGLSNVDLHKQIRRNPPGTPQGKFLRYERYWRRGGTLPFDKWAADLANWQPGTPRPEPGRQIDGLAEIARIRREQGLPPYNPKEDKTGTIARVEHGDAVEYGASPGISPYENLPAGVRQVLDKVSNTHKLKAVKVMVTHAEAEALTRAYPKGTKDEVVMFTDRPTCDYCVEGLPYLLKELGIKKLTITHTKGETTIVPAR